MSSASTELIIIIRPSFKRFCGQDACRAALFNQFLFWIAWKANCQENAPQYASWISQYLSRHTQQGKSIAWMKEDIIKLLNTSDAMSEWLADQVGRKEEEQARIERDKIRTRLSEVA